MVFFRSLSLFLTTFGKTAGATKTQRQRNSAAGQELWTQKWQKQSGGAGTTPLGVRRSCFLSLSLYRPHSLALLRMLQSWASKLRARHFEGGSSGVGWLMRNPSTGVAAKWSCITESADQQINGKIYCLQELRNLRARVVHNVYYVSKGLIEGIFKVKHTILKRDL